MKNTGKKTEAALLRRKAETFRKEKPRNIAPHLSEGDTRKLVHELEVHQIELEMQNEELQRAQSAAQEIAQKYSELYDLSPSGYVTLTADGNVKEINHTCARMLGRERPQLINCRFGLLVLLEARPVFEGFLKRVFNGKGTTTCEVPLTTHSAAPMYAHLTGVVFHRGQECLITVTDMTEHKKNEDALREKEQMLSAIFNATSESIWLVNLDGRILGANEIAANFLRIDLADADGANWFDLLPEPIGIARKATLAEVTASGNAVYYEDERDGIIFNHTFYPVKDAFGNTQAVAVFSNDITKRRKAEEELARLHEQTQIDAAIKTELLNEVNHRVKNNLMMILGLILAEKRRAFADGDHAMHGGWEKFESRIKGLMNVHQMLSDSHWKPINLAMLAERVCAGVVDSTGNAESPVNLSVDDSDIKVSPRQAGNLALVFNELITNCLKYAFKETRNPSIRISSKREDETIHIEFSDNGCGYPEHILNHGDWNVGLRLLQQIIEGTLNGQLLLINQHGAVTRIMLEQDEKNQRK